MTFNTELWNGAAPLGPTEPRSLRFNSGDSAFLSRTPASAGNRKTWTWAAWVKLSEIPNTTARYVFQALSGSSRTTIKFESDKLYFDLISTSNQLITTQVFRDPSAWYHIVAAVDTTDATSSNRAKLYINGVQVTAFSTATYPSQNADTYVNSTTAHYIGAYDPSYNHFNGYLADVHFVDGQALDPTSFGEFDATTGVWNPIEVTGLSYGTNGFHLDFSDNSSAAALGYDAAGSNDWTVNNISVAPTSIDTTQKWSGLLSASGGSGFVTQGAGGFAGFDDTNNYTYVAGAGAGTNYTITLTPASTISFTSSLVVRVESGNSEVTIDGGSNWVADTGGLVTFTGPGSFSAITVRDSRGQYSGEFNSVKVDGVLLVDPGALTYDDSLRDTPTNGDTANDTGLGGEVAGNYCTWNPLDNNGITLSNGNLTAYKNSAGAWSSVVGTIGVSSGKWYWETVFDTQNYSYVGISKSGWDKTYLGSDANSWGYYSGDGKLWTSGAGSSYGASWTSGDVIGVGFDADNGTLTFYKNGTSQGTAATGLTAGPYFPGISLIYTITGNTNFGQRRFAHQAPTGFRPLATPFLPTPTIEDGSDYMDVSPYSGNSGTQSITGLQFSPDLVWLKGRSQADRHYLFDTVRGKNAVLASNETTSETDYSSLYPNYLQSFNSDGFTLGYYAAQGGLNKSGETYVAWTWDAGSQRVYAAEVTGAFNPGAGADKIFDGSTSTEASHSGGASDTFTWQLAEPLTVSTSLEVYLNSGLSKFRVNGGTQSSALSSGSWHNLGFTGSLTSLEVQGDGVYAPRLAAIRIDGTIVVDPARNTQGTIASTVKANPSAGFSVVTYTGTGSSASVGHGLNAAPAFYVTKRRDSSSFGNWTVYHSAIGTQFLELNATGAAGTDANRWPSAATSTVFNIGSGGNVNVNGGSFVAYCFAPVAGYSAFGSYTGTGSATNSPFIWTGFRPRWLLIKNTTPGSTEYWILIDSARSPENVANEFLYPNDSLGEGTLYFDTDLLSNGFKLKNSVRATNQSGETYIYAAFAENPFSIARAR